jgi:hypothetical protein
MIMSIKGVNAGAPKAQSVTKKSREFRALRRAIRALIVTSTAIAVWYGREALLRGVADVWIVSDQPTSSDAIIVLGGDFQSRPLVAADLYREGLATTVLISATAGGPGASPSYTELTRNTLLKNGVPPTAIKTFGDLNRNTRDEAVALLDWAKVNSASSFIIPDEIFGTRRVSWIFRRKLGKVARVEVLGFEPPAYSRRDWWRSDQGLIAFQNEVLKYLYYRLKY